MATCRSCNARIVWCETPSGKKIPLDTPSKPVAHVVDPGKGLFVSHFVTCAFADEHRTKADKHEHWSDK